MRSVIYSLLSLATLATALAIETKTPEATTADDDWDDKQPDTIFNGQTVPPMIELGQDSLDKEISTGNWCVCCIGQ
jgi:protein disulfide-isomerase